MAEISNVTRLAKVHAAVPFKAAVSAVCRTIGDPTGAGFQANNDRLLAHIDAVTDSYVLDASLIARKVTMKPGVNMGAVQQTISLIIDAAGVPDRPDPVHDTDIVSYAVLLLLIPAWERMGFLNQASAATMTNEDRARSLLLDFATTHGGSLQLTELVRQTYSQATDPVDTKIGSLPQDMSIGLRRACTQGAKELTAHEPELAASIRGKRDIPARFNASALAVKWTMSLLLRMIAPIIAHRMKGSSLFCSVASIYDVLLANNPAAPFAVIIEEKREQENRDPNSKKTKH